MYQKINHEKYVVARGTNYLYSCDDGECTKDNYGNY